MDFTCPLCGSHHATRLALVQAKGRSRSQSWSLTAGGGGIFSLALAFLTLPFKLFGFGSITRTRGTSETFLASETAPPAPIPIGKFVVVALVVTTMMMSMVSGIQATSLAVHNGLGIVIGNLATFGVLAFFIASIVAANRYNRTVWPQKEAEWQRTFLCGRCGATYVVPEYSPDGVKPVRSDRIGKGGGLPKTAPPDIRDTIH